MRPASDPEHTQQIHEIIASLAEEQDMEVQDVPEYEPSYEVDMTFVSLLYNYILAPSGSSWLCLDLSCVPYLPL